MVINKTALIEIAKKLFNEGVPDITTAEVKLTVEDTVFQIKYHTKEQFEKLVTEEFNDAQQLMLEISNSLPTNWDKIEFNFEDGFQRYFVKQIKD